MKNTKKNSENKPFDWVGYINEGREQAQAKAKSPAKQRTEPFTAKEKAAARRAFLNN